jgi:carboxymethylenebutenolidase
VFEPSGQSTRRKGGVILYMDAFGLRPEFDGLCRSYAEAGYVAFLPDLYYRLPVRRFAVPASAGEPLDPAMHDANAATTLEMTLADTGALLAHVLAAPRYGVRRFGTVGHCMGGRHAIAAAATFPEEIAAAASLHGGRLVWDGETSPHLYIPRVQAEIYFAFAAHDETCPDAHKALIERTIAESGVRGTTEHYAAAHGWTFPERWCFDRDAAERTFARVLALFDANVPR